MNLLILSFFYLAIFLSLFIRGEKKIFLGAILLPSLLPFFFKPVFIFFYGTPVLYSNFFSLEAATKGMLFETLWLLIIVAMVSVKVVRREKVVAKRINKIDEKSLAMYLVALALSATLLFGLLGSSFLAVNRSTSLAVMAPWTRYVYPFILFGQIVAIAYFAKSRVLKMGGLSTWLPIAALLFGFILINQRGIILSGIIYYFSILLITKRITYLKLLFGLPFLFALAAYAKVMNTFLQGGNILEDLFFILEGPDGVSLQIWSILYSYVEVNGYSHGTSLLSGLVGIIPASYRVELGLLNITDHLNLFYHADGYLNSGFGFNGSFTQDAFLSFGWFGLLLAFPIGYVVNRLLETSLSYLKSERFTELFLVLWFTSIFLVGGFQVLHWFLIPLSFLVLGKLKLGSSPSRIKSGS